MNFDRLKYMSPEELEEYREQKSLVNRGTGAMSTFASFAGAGISAGAENARTGAVGGALQGFSTGAAFGPIGMLLGAGAGALTGAVRGGNIASAQAGIDEARRNSIADNYAVPTTFGPGGFALNNVQTEDGEWAAIPSGKLVKVAADKHHSEMGKDYVTDNMEQESYVFSSRPSQTFRTEDLRLPQGAVSYYEEGQKGVTTKDPDSLEVFGNKEMTPAEAVAAVAKKFKLNANSDKDAYYNNPIARATDADHIKSRAAYVSAIAQQQELRKGEIALASQETVQGDIQLLSGVTGSSVVGRPSFSEFYNREKAAIDQQIPEAQNRYAEDMDAYGALAGRLNMRSAAAAASQALSAAASPIAVEAPIIRNRNMSAFRETSPAEREAAVLRSQSGYKAALQAALANGRYDQIGALTQAVENAGLPVEREFNRRDERARLGRQREIARISDANARSRAAAINLSNEKAGRALQGVNTGIQQGFRDFNTIDTSLVGTERQAANRRDYTIDQASRESRSLDAAKGRYDLSQERMDDARTRAQGVLDSYSDLNASGQYIPDADLASRGGFIPQNEIDPFPVSEFDPSILRGLKI